MSIICTGNSITATCIEAGRALINDLLAPLGLSIRRDVPFDTEGFTYVIYMPHAHREGEEKYLYVGGTRKRVSDQYFGSCRAAGYADARRRGAIRFIIELTGNNREACNDAERRLLHGLQVDEDRRFWNQHKGAGAGWGREVAAAAYRQPGFREKGRERALKAAATKKQRASSLR